MGPFFSIIIPVYNVAAYLRKCLDSILAQTFTDWEAICVDDGSTDESGVILDAYCKKDSRFIIIRQENGGEGAARNAGLEVANGDWLVYVDSDDIISKDMLYDFATIIERFSQIDIVRCRTAVFQDGLSPVWSGSGALKVMDLSTKIPDEVGMFGVTELAYRVSKFGRIRFTNHRIGEDLVYTSRCFANANLVASLDKANYGYRIRNGSMAHRPDTPERIKERIEFLTVHFQNFESSGKLVGKRLARSRINMWLEKCACAILSNPTSKEWQTIWGFWCDSLSYMRTLSYASPWQRAVAGLIFATRSHFLAKMVCAMPHKLKALGFHR